MNQQTANSSFTNNSSATSTLAATPSADTAAPAETPLAKPTARESQSPAKANARKATLARKDDDRCRHYTHAGRIHSFLAQLTVLVVQNRVSTRRAAILAYLGQLLLRTQRAMDEEVENEPQQFIFDLPRPKRD